MKDRLVIQTFLGSEGRSGTQGLGVAAYVTPSGGHELIAPPDVGTTRSAVSLWSVIVGEGLAGAVIWT